MRKIAAFVPLALAAACTTPYGDEPYDPSGYPPAPYPGEPYPQPYPPPYPPQPYPEPYPPQPYPEPYPPAYPAPPVAQPPGGMAPPLDRTRWAVVAINNRPTPRQGEFSIEFDAGRLSAKFGCNGLGAGYTQTGSTIDAGAIIGTQMACPDMSWENQGAAVLDQVMQVHALAANRITLTSSAGTIELQRR